MAHHICNSMFGVKFTGNLPDNVQGVMFLTAVGIELTKFLGYYGIIYYNWGVRGIISSYVASSATNILWDSYIRPRYSRQNYSRQNYSRREESDEITPAIIRSLFTIIFASTIYNYCIPYIQNMSYMPS